MSWTLNLFAVIETFRSHVNFIARKIREYQSRCYFLMELGDWWKFESIGLFRRFKDNYSCAPDRISKGVIASSRTRPSRSTRFRPSVTLKNDAVLVRRARKCREKEKEGKGKGKRKSERGNNGWTRRADREKGEYRGSRQITRETELLCVELLSP